MKRASCLNASDAFLLLASIECQLDCAFVDQDNVGAMRKRRPQPSRVGKKGVTVYVPEETWRELRVLAATTDTTIDALIREGIEYILRERRYPPPPIR